MKSIGNFIKFRPYQNVVAIADIDTGVQFAFSDKVAWRSASLVAFETGRDILGKVGDA